MRVAASSRAICAPEFPAPTTSAGPSGRSDGRRYALEWSLHDLRRERRGHGRDGGPVERPRRDHHLVGFDDAAPRPARAHHEPRPVVRAGDRLDARVVLDGEREVRGVAREVVGHLLPGRQVHGRRGERQPREPAVGGRGEEPERVPAPPPRLAGPRLGVEDYEVLAAGGELLADGESGLPAADDDGADAQGQPRRGQGEVWRHGRPHGGLTGGGYTRNVGR